MPESKTHNSDENTRLAATSPIAVIWGLASLLVFLSSVLAHCATFVPSLPISMALVWPLHLASMVVFVVMVFSLVAQQMSLPKIQAEGWLANIRAKNQRSKEFQRRLIRLAPLPWRIVGGVLFAYVALNFVLFMMLMQEGSPRAHKGQYFLVKKGVKVRKLSAEEYQRFRAYEVRGFSGHWMFFSMIPMTYFLVVHPRLGQLKEELTR